MNERLEHREVPLHNASPSLDTLFLQFSGGTTGAQKAIVVTTNMLLHQLSQLRDAVEFTSDDGVVSWLPLYHDMGLIACYWMPLWFGAPSLHIAAGDWIINPELLLKCVSRYRASFCWLPNFSFAYLSQRREHMKGGYPLDSVRAWIDCSEPVRLNSLKQFAVGFCGLRSAQGVLTSFLRHGGDGFAITQSQSERSSQRSLVNSCTLAVIRTRGSPST